jgi:hypothetical protein
VLACDPTGLFERFTPSAREVAVLAQEEARGLQHNHVGTEHQLLGLLREEGSVAARALGSLGVTVERVRQEALQAVAPAEQATARQIPFTPRAKQVLELACREADSVGSERVGPEHILLGMLRDDQDLAVRILLGCGADVEKIRGQLTHRLRGLNTSETAERAGSDGVRHPIDQAWLGPLGAHINALATEIRRELGREPDAGDLLIALACDADTIAAHALNELAVDPSVISATMERLRTRNHADGDVGEQIDELTRAKERAIETDQPEEAARLEDQEQELRRKQRAQEDGMLMPDVLAGIRHQLGLRQPGFSPALRPHSKTAGLSLSPAPTRRLAEAHRVEQP